MKGNDSQKQDKQYMVPMEITMEAARDFGIDPKDLIWFPLGIQKCRVYLVPASREVYLAYMQPVWAEVKRMVREGRCMIKGKSGKLIRCPESNRCEDCKLFSKVNREQNKPMSLSVLLDEGIEPTMESFEDDAIYSILFKELIAMLTEIKPKFGEIFPMLCDEATQQEISDKLGIKQRTVSDDIKKIRSILQPLMDDIFNR